MMDLEKEIRAVAKIYLKAHRRKLDRDELWFDGMRVLDFFLRYETEYGLGEEETDLEWLE
jgi:hypothetical protein